MNKLINRSLCNKFRLFLFKNYNNQRSCGEICACVSNSYLVRNLTSARTDDISILNKSFNTQNEEQPPDQKHVFEKNSMLELIKKKFYYDASFDIYGGIAGQYDFGPLGCAIIDNILSEWHRHFVIHDQMHKIQCSTLTPQAVLEASGHVEKFTDIVVKDKITGEFFRLDHLIKDSLEDLISCESTSQLIRNRANQILNKIDGLDKDDMEEVVKEFQLKSPVTGNDLGEASYLNLMFPVTFGSSGYSKGFLRPEIAQGIFTNFKRLLNYNNGKLPFACAQVGNVFRNEISPKYGLLRTREFTTAEVEHFYSPLDESHPKYFEVSERKLCFYSSAEQERGEDPVVLTISEAVKTGIIGSENLAYFLARIQDYLLRIGIDSKKLRFRQHLSKELAHYATDCWDAECLTSYGWVECVGCADRRAFDLNAHSRATGVELFADVPLAESRQEEVVSLILNKRLMKTTFKDNMTEVRTTLDGLSQSQVVELDKKLQTSGEVALNDRFSVTRDMIPGVKTTMKETFTERVIPSVIEPSFGIQRIFYTLLEHSFRIRETDEKRKYFAFQPFLAPIKLGILPIVNKEEFSLIAQEIADRCSELDLTVKVEDSKGSVGRRYVRMDEMAIPFCVTIDDATLGSSRLVTLRNRDTTRQVRIPIAKLPQTIKDICSEKITWENVLSTWPSVA